MDKRCVIIGNQGAGKTRLFNLICSQKEKSDQSMDSNTKIIAQSQSVHGYGFHLLDTPGFGSYDEEVLTHSIGILAALTDGPIHRIILVVEYQQRIDILIQQIQDAITIVEEYHEIITIIITHKDKCKISINEYFSKAQEMIKKNFEVQSVYFSGNNTQCEELCSFIDQALQIQIINIQDSKFDKMMQGYIDNVLRQAKEKFYNKFQEFYLAAKCFLDSFKSEIEDSQQILHYFISFVTNKSAAIQNDFEKNYVPFMEELHERNNDPVKAYYYHSVLKHSITEQVQELIKAANQKMKYPEDHPYRQLRRCPRCGTIWLKVAGCNGITQCGKRTNKYQTDVMLITSLFSNYKFDITNNQIYYTVIQDQPQHTDYQIQSIKKITQELISQYTELEEFIQMINSNNFQDMNQFIETVAEYIITPSQSLNDKGNEKQQSFLQFFKNGNQALKNKLVEQNHRNQIKNKGQIGCGFEIDWQSAPLVDINEIDTDQVQILDSLQKENLIYQEQFHIHKQKLVMKAQQDKKILTQK